ncbi:CubicO group peptidase (beta-lactamase class C family) [Janthinobacterium sp. 61]|uniref:serine hydrolase domain-containing protein n=1 Tax=Janthinobacterium sp. 61 TaxID=2035209 RepID=UPI000C70802D|nr:serine hydrolase domain-containing protein [Janthinobacterium sp. 61]PKV42948.1 CubicO group peptidase (beta-lactamase class C family) [Janthinobacterium sp. 61]
MQSSKHYGFAGALALLCGVAQAASEPAPALAARLADFDGWAAQRMATQRLPGVTVGFSQGDVEWVKGYGYADLENRVPATARSSYRLASVTKPMTAVAILQLVEQGKVDLDAPVQTYVPYFPVKPFPVTVRQLLGHLGGIDAYRNSQVEQHFKEHKDTRQSIAVFEQFDLIAEPGTRFRYTSYGYNLLGAVIEGASGESYGGYMRRHVWGPLGMDATVLDDPDAVIAHRVRGYRLAGKELKNSEFVDISSRFSAGGTRASVPDMLAFGRGVHAGKILSAASVAAMVQPMATRAGRLTHYGMGWEIFPTGGRYAIAHSGQQPETVTYLYSFPSRKLTIAVAANLERVNPEAFVQRLFEVVTGEPWQLKTYIADAGAQRAYQVAQGLFEEGRAHAERTHESYADAAATRLAFTQINGQALAPDATVARPFIEAARHPAGGRVFLAAGASMAEALRQSGIDLDTYSRGGALAFARDYVLLSRSKAAGTLPRFDPAFEQAMVALAASWDRTAAIAWPAAPAPASASIAAIDSQLRAAFHGQRAYPDFVPELQELAQASAGRGEAESALAASRLAVELYPLSDRAHALQGLTLLGAGKREPALAALRLALARDPLGAASPAALNLEAYRLKGSGAVAQGMAVLQAAASLHPRDANLQDSLAEFYVEQGLRPQAVAAYRQALQLDPRYPGAVGARAAIIRLGGETKALAP